MRGLVWSSVVAAVAGGGVVGCHPKTELVRPPTEDWRPSEQPLAVGVTAEAFYLAAVQLMVERGFDLQLDHADAHTLVSGWIDAKPPMLIEVTSGPATESSPNSTAGVTQVALVVTVLPAAVRVDIRCRERVPIAPRRVPVEFDRCPTAGRPPAAIATAVNVVSEAMVRAARLTNAGPVPAP